MKGLSILGSTGSVGTNVLRVGGAFADRFRVVGLAAGANAERLAEQVARHRPRVVSVATPAARDALARLVDLSGVAVVTGPDGMVEVATHPDARLVVASAVGAVGLVPTYRALQAGKDGALANKETLVVAGGVGVVPTYRALQAGKDVALANKETLVMAGELMVAQARARGGCLLPIDSE